MDFFSRGSSCLHVPDPEWRERLTEGAEQFLAIGPSVSSGTFAIEDLKNAAEAKQVSILCEDVFPAPTDAMSLALHLETAAKNYPIPFGALCTVKTKGGGNTGSTFGVYVDEACVDCFDTHKKRGEGGATLGCCLAHVAAHDWSLMATWIVHHLCPILEADPSLIEVVIVAQKDAITWDPKVQEAVQGDVVLQKMRALRPIFNDRRQMLPGDYINHAFHGDPLLQLCAAGMKFAPFQEYMHRTLDFLKNEDGVANIEKVVAWLLNAWCAVDTSSVACHNAQRAHGNLSYDGGATMFLTHCEIVTTSKPFACAAPIQAPVDSLYYLSLAPTARLAQLRDGLLKLSKKRFSTGLEYLRLERELKKLLEQHLPHADLNCYSEKLMEYWRVVLFSHILGYLAWTCAYTCTEHWIR